MLSKINKQGRSVKLSARKVVLKVVPRAVLRKVVLKVVAKASSFVVLVRLLAPPVACLVDDVPAGY